MRGDLLVCLAPLAKTKQPEAPSWRAEDFAGIYGFSGAYLAKLREHDIPRWRRFLCEVIDPRFVATSGEKLTKR